MDARYPVCTFPSLIDYLRSVPPLPLLLLQRNTVDIVEKVVWLCAIDYELMARWWSCSNQTRQEAQWRQYILENAVFWDCGNCPPLWGGKECSSTSYPMWQNVALCRDGMGTWVKSKWLWMALKTTVSPRTVPGEEWFASMQKEVSTAGRAEGQWCASSGEETSGKLYFGDNMRKHTGICSRVAQTPWAYGLYTQGRVWCESAGTGEQKNPGTGSNMHDGRSLPRCQSSLWGGSGWTWYRPSSSWWLVHQLPPIGREIAHTGDIQEPV